MKHGKYPLIITFLVPPLLLYGIFVLSPYLQAFQISTTDWLGYSAELPTIVGLDNFATLLRDEYLWNAVEEQRDPAGLLPVLTIALGLFFATMLNMGGRRGHRRCGRGARHRGLPAGLLLPAGALGGDHRAALEGGLPPEQRPAQRRAARAGPAPAPTWLGDPRTAFWACWR